MVGYRIATFNYVAELVKSFDFSKSFESLDDFRYQIGRNFETVGSTELLSKLNLHPNTSETLPAHPAPR